MRVMAKLAPAICACLVLVAGCSSGSSSAASRSSGSERSSAASGEPAVGSSARTITVGGVERRFLLYRPASLPPGPVPLVVMIHGGGGSAQGAERFYGWDAEADAGHFAVAFPDGTDRGWAVGGGCCGTPGSTGVDDVAFISQLVDTVSHQLPIDPTRVYATGISEGGMLSYRLACQSSVFAAVAPDSATLLGGCPSPRPISMLHIHGTADARIRYDGSPGAGVNHITGVAVPALNEMWRSIDRCAAPSVTRAGVVTTSTAACPGNRAVELITIAGAGHQWPGAVCTAKCVRGASDPPSTALDATHTIWQFFAAHPG